MPDDSLIRLPTDVDLSFALWLPRIASWGRSFESLRRKALADSLTTRPLAESKSGKELQQQRADKVAR
jgi:hypothetical protein